jgi:hypothetical protein|tara:strand:+ start:3734 stop:4003 length:270 start_codon:yes stop_codon:yes gene_type:complete
MSQKAIEPNLLRERIDGSVNTQTVEFRAHSQKAMIGHVSGNGTLEYWDGASYTAYLESSEGFKFTSPVSGKLRLVVTSGSVTFSMATAH